MRQLLILEIALSREQKCEGRSRAWISRGIWASANSKSSLTLLPLLTFFCKVTMATNILVWRLVSRDSERETGKLRLFMCTVRLTTSLIVWLLGVMTLTQVLLCAWKMIRRSVDGRIMMLEE
ncbi:hypothetical protein LINPERHAP1_LOCUS13255 [Linum perenne]